VIRPMDYQHDDVTTWDYTEIDEKLFGEWLHLCFGADAKRIIFVLLHEGTPVEDRKFEINLGKMYSGNSGGRPRKIKVYDEFEGFNAVFNENAIEEEAVRFAREFGMNAAKIRRYFVSKMTDEQVDNLVDLRMFQIYLKKAGVETKRGKPKNIKISEENKVPGKLIENLIGIEYMADNNAMSKNNERISIINGGDKVRSNGRDNGICPNTFHWWYKCT